MWLGIRTLGRPAPTVRVADQAVSNPQRHWQFDAYTFQVGIQSHTALGMLVASHSLAEKSATIFGFTTTRPVGTIVFQIGMLYADTLACLHSDALPAARQLLGAIKNVLDGLPASTVLSMYLEKMRSLLESQSLPAQVRGEFLTLFETLFSEYARGAGSEFLPLFRAGVWLESLYLAALAGDEAALRRGNAVAYFQSEMETLHAPQGVRDTLEQLRFLLSQPVLTDADVAAVRKRIQRLHALLG